MDDTTFQQLSSLAKDTLKKSNQLQAWRREFHRRNAEDLEQIETVLALMPLARQRELGLIKPDESQAAA